MSVANKFLSFSPLVSICKFIYLRSYYYFHPNITSLLILNGYFHGPKVLIIMRSHCTDKQVTSQPTRSPDLCASKVVPRSNFSPIKIILWVKRIIYPYLLLFTHICVLYWIPRSRCLFQELFNIIRKCLNYIHIDYCQVLICHKSYV